MAFIRWIDLQPHYLSIGHIKQQKTCTLDKKTYPLDMDITPEQLRYLREQRRMTREELAEELNCSASAIVHWEGGKREIPSWVADKMFSKLPITFTVQELSEMYDLCREEAFTMGELIQEAVRMRLEQRRAAQTKDAQNITYRSGQEQSSRAAEEPPPPRKRNGTED